MIKKENYNKNAKKPDKVAKNEENEKISWKAGNMLYPLPAVVVSLTDKEGRSNIITLAWAGIHLCYRSPSDLRGILMTS